MNRLRVVLLLLLLAPIASAQTLANPIEGAFEDIYIITGRGIDALGRPTVGAEIILELDQPGARAAPLKATSDCFGVFIAYFELAKVTPEGSVKVTLKGRGGGPDVVTTEKLDHFYRRSDVSLQYEGQWDSHCPQQTALWDARVSVTGRIVNRTPEREVGGAKYFAAPYAGVAQLRYWDSPTHYTCPPLPDDPRLCDRNAGTVDERGDFRYSWLFFEPFEPPAGAFMQVIVDGQSHNFTIDSAWRVAVARIETSGLGPTAYPTPAASLVAVLAVSILAAVVLRKKRDRA